MRIPIGLPGNEMEGVGIQHVGDASKPEKGIRLAHEIEGERPLLPAEAEAPVDDARQAVAISEAPTPEAGFSLGAAKSTHRNRLLHEENLGDADLSLSMDGRSHARKAGKSAETRNLRLSVERKNRTHTMRTVGSLRPHK